MPCRKKPCRFSGRDCRHWVSRYWMISGKQQLGKIKTLLVGLTQKGELERAI